MLKRSLAVSAAVVMSVLLAACGSSGSSGSAAKGTAVNVLYAGSLVNLMEKQVGPGFDTATGNTFTGFGAGSTALVAQIKGKVHQGDIFISASSKANDALKGAANGNWETWYIKFASAGLVLGYNPNSKFAHDLQTKPWYQVVTEPGFRLGSTDPATDPKGKLAAQALTDTAKAKNLTALKALASNSANFFPEETLVGRLQAGQLDAGFFYTSEAKAAGIATVPLTGVDLKATYTITILANAPHVAAAEAFVKYLLGPAGQTAMKQDGFKLISPVKAVGTVPAALSSVLQ
jgi:molybdate/tungstate transport system substrate-binding protein